MSVKIRLARGGSKKRPYYHVVAADVRMPRDGRFIEKLGAYNPLLAKDDPLRFHVKEDRVKEWLANGAQPTDRVARYLSNLGLCEWTPSNNPNKAKPGQKAMERLEEKKAAEEAAAEAAKEAEEAAKAAAAEAEGGSEEAAE